MNKSLLAGPRVEFGLYSFLQWVRIQISNEPSLFLQNDLKGNSISSPEFWTL